jgi:hypothetical protein
MSQAAKDGTGAIEILSMPTAGWRGNERADGQQLAGVAATRPAREAVVRNRQGVV